MLRSVVQGPGNNPDWALSAEKRVPEAAWEAFLAANPRGHFQQSWRWAQFKAAEGWRGVGQTWASDDRLEGGFLMLVKETRWGRVGFINKGPVLREETDRAVEEALVRVKRVAHEHRLRALVVQPPDSSRIDAATLCRHGFGRPPVPGVIDATLVVEVTGGTDAIEARMSRSARLNSRSAARAGVEVVEGGREHLRLFFELMLSSCRRQKTRPNPSRPELFEHLWDVWHPDIRLLLARYQGSWVAGLLLIRFGRRCTFWKTGWSQAFPKLHANALLNHRALVEAATWDCELVDLGAMDRALALRWREGQPMEEALARSRHAFNLCLGARPTLLPEARLYVPAWYAPLIYWTLGRPGLGRWLCGRFGG